MNEFVEVKIADLSGEALNWAVAIAENLTAFVSPPQYGNPHLVCVMSERVHRGGYRFSPSTDWSQGGPLIAKYRLEIVRDGDFYRSVRDWIYCEPYQWWPSGETHLIAACRAIVASVLGETVSVPKELLS